MKLRRARCLLAMVAAGVGLLPFGASAQPIGTFRWQLLPYCNLITVNVSAQGTVFTLDGVDDQCGADQRASVVGTAFLNPDGTIGIGLSTVTAPGAAFVHVDARIGLSSLGGPWRDSAGNNGAFIFAPGGGVGGPPRPVAPNGIAPGSITASQLAPGSVSTGHLAPGAVTGTAIADLSITRADILDGPRVAFAAGAQAIELSQAGAVVRSVTLVAPAAGTVLANASGLFFLENAGPAISGGRCALTADAATDLAHAADAIKNTSNLHTIPFGLTRVFTVAPGPFCGESLLLAHRQRQHCRLEHELDCAVRVRRLSASRRV